MVKKFCICLPNCDYTFLTNVQSRRTELFVVLFWQALGIALFTVSFPLDGLITYNVITQRQEVVKSLGRHISADCMVSGD